MIPSLCTRVFGASGIGQTHRIVTRDPKIDRATP